MIHAGAIVAAGLSQGSSKSMSIRTMFLKRHRKALQYYIDALPFYTILIQNKGCCASARPTLARGSVCILPLEANLPGSATITTNETSCPLELPQG